MSATTQGAYCRVVAMALIRGIATTYLATAIIFRASGTPQLRYTELASPLLLGVRSLPTLTNEKKEKRKERPE